MKLKNKIGEKKDIKRLISIWVKILYLWSESW
jgi:hypothetical protein